MGRTAVGVMLLAAVLLSGCACLPAAGLAAVGIAGAVVFRDPSHAVLPVAECLGCFRAARR